MGLLHRYIDVVLVLVRIIEFHDILVFSERAQYFHFSCHIFYCNGCRQLQIYYAYEIRQKIFPLLLGYKHNSIPNLYFATNTYVFWGRTSNKYCLQWQHDQRILSKTWTWICNHITGNCSFFYFQWYLPHKETCYVYEESPNFIDNNRKNFIFMFLVVSYLNSI